MQLTLQQEMQKPKAVKWFAVFCVLSALLCLILMIGGVSLIKDAPYARRGDEIELVGIYMFVIGLVLFLAYAAAPFLPPKSWSWTFGVILIVLDMASLIGLPFAIPMLIFWIESKTQNYFGRRMASSVPVS
jgi:hypothetical protein